LLSIFEWSFRQANKQPLAVWQQHMVTLPGRPVCSCSSDVTVFNLCCIMFCLCWIEGSE